MKKKFFLQLVLIAFITVLISPITLFSFALEENENSATNIVIEKNENHDMDVAIEEKAIANTENVLGAYVSSLQLTNIIDGSAPFDLSNTPGNDEKENNKIVRTFDTIQYELKANFNSINDSDVYKKATMVCELIMYKSITEAQFEISKMNWVKEDWVIQYLDKDGNVAITETKSGMVDQNGKSIKINDIVQDSTKGEESYKTKTGKIIEQRLIAKYDIENGDGSNAIPGYKKINTYIKVNASKNKQTFEPKFKIWLEGNEENIGRDGTKNTNNIYDISSTNEATKENVVTVSAKPRYNAIIRQNPDCSYKTYLNLATGQEETTKTENTILGRILSYGVTLQLYNETDNSSIKDIKVKGLKGIELPQGEISFDMTITEKKPDSWEQIQQKEYIPILWDYYENKGVENLSGEQKNKGHWGRKMYWNNETRTTYAKGGAPYNTGNNSSSCYQGGTWKIAEGKIESTDNLINASRVYHVSVSGYDFDFDNYRFPTCAAGNAGEVEWLKKAFSFSAGQFQFAIQFPEDIPQTTNVKADIKISNLKATSISNTKVEDTNNTQNGAEVYYNDNGVNHTVNFYNKGSITKGNSFNGKDSLDIGKDFLGTAYWEKSYDCTAYVGDQISILGYTMLNAGSDNRLKAFNLLQKFDSKALEIDTTRELKYRAAIGTGDIAGTASFLYAADPLYPNGYDSNNTEEMKRMNAAREEDYVYFKTIDELKDKGYTCVAVLTEMRNANIMGGKYLYGKIPVKVKENSQLIGKTICTVNSARVWIDDGDMSGITWLNGNYDETTQKNTLNGWKTPYYTNSNDQIGYIKTEYENGEIVSGTHRYGPQYGISLLILGYQTEVNMVVQNKDTNDIESNTNTPINFDVDKGQRTATYKITSKTATGSTAQSDAKTKLKITVNLNAKLKVTPKGYKISNTLISDNPDEPTIITISGKAIKIYANRDTSGNQVEFYLEDVPLGVSIPDIVFTAEIGSAGSSQDVKNGETLEANVIISGEGDNRPITVENKNMDVSQIAIISLESASLSKAVDKEFTEINEGFNYTLNYTNSGQTAVQKGYIYDLLPYNGDTLNSKVNGVLDVEQINATLIGGEGSTFDATVEIYYSTIIQSKLKPIVETFGSESEQTGSSIDQMLEKGFLGTDGECYIDEDGTLANNTAYDKLFTKLGTIQSEETKLKRENTSSPQQPITCIYAIVKDVQANKVLKLNLSMKVENNEATDIYGNIFYNWIAGNSKLSSLRSNSVYTTVISRSISGAIWNDTNCNGIKDKNETNISGVEVDLFKYNKDTNKYEPHTENILGQQINTVLTDENGKYEFSKLSSGEYIVAFRGEILKDYTTTKYQVNGSNDENTNDGIKTEELNKTEFTDYNYVIKYSSTDSQFKLHTISEIIEQNIALENYQEKLKQQDLGLCNVNKFEFTKVKAENTEERNIWYKIFVV